MCREGVWNLLSPTSQGIHKNHNSNLQDHSHPLGSKKAGRSWQEQDLTSKMHFSAEHWAHSRCHTVLMPSPVLSLLSLLLSCWEGQGSSPALLPRPAFTPGIPTTSAQPCSELIRRVPLPTAPTLQKTSRCALPHCASQQRRAREG